MEIEAIGMVEQNWDKLIHIFASKFCENEWDELISKTPPCATNIEGVPCDTLSVLVSLFGSERGVHWLCYDKTYRNESIIEFLRTYPNKRLAIKAVNFRVLKLYNQNLNNSFLNTLKFNYRNVNWDKYISDLRNRGQYKECTRYINCVDQSVVNIIYSSRLSAEAKDDFFFTPIYELHGLTPVELSQSKEGKDNLKLYMLYLGVLKSGEAAGI